MTDVDQLLREAADEVRSMARSSTDLDADLAATLARTGGLGRPAPTGHQPAGRGTVALRVAAVGLLVVAVGAAMLWARRGDDGDDLITSPASTAAPATTGGPATTVATSEPPAPTTSAEPAQPAQPAEIDLLAAWPEPSFEAWGDLESVPLLFPSATVPRADAADRVESDNDPPEIVDYTQTWVAADGESSLTITTNLDQVAFPPTENRDDIVVAPWDAAFATPTGPGSTSLTLADPSGYVSIHALGLERSVVEDVAASLAPRAGSPGWDVTGLPDELIAVEDGWYGGEASRSVHWYRGDRLLAELEIFRGNIELFTSAWFPESSVAVTEVGGATAVATQDDTRAAVVWSPEPGVQVRFGIVGTVDEALQITRSMSVVDLATWEASSVVADRGDGCTSLFC